MSALEGQQLRVIPVAVVCGSCFAGINAGLPFAPPLLFAGLHVSFGFRA